MIRFTPRLPTELKGGYSQGLIHRKIAHRQKTGAENPLGVNFSSAKSAATDEKVRGGGPTGGQVLTKGSRYRDHRHDLERPRLNISSREAGYLPMQKLEKILPSRSSELNAPVISPSACCACRRSSANSSPAPASVS
ncbi:hypothetical protein BW686_09370 [Pseudomonas syringae]|uniref:Uncharacterized protein n=1 Tax=Pseudomonas syringae TaxID=317 RepID=A0A244ETM8_PSESX|nr:hypothetical protein BW686_09370 [Pseudomonas syringae]